MSYKQKNSEKDYVLKDVNDTSFFQRCFSDNPKERNARKQIFGAYDNWNGDKLNIDVGKNNKKKILSYASKFTKELEKENEGMEYDNKYGGGEPSAVLGFLSFLGAEAIYFTQVRDTISDPLLQIGLAGMIGTASYSSGLFVSLILGDALKGRREDKIKINKKKIEYLSKFHDYIK